MEPPPFQEAPRCDVCKSSFTTFRRRHHCRRCGRTLCAEHSSNQMALPQFGIHTFVRVCSNCFNDASRLSRDDVQPLSNEVDSIKDMIVQMDINASLDMNPKPGPSQGLKNLECKCGMPLCICEVPTPPPMDSVVPSKSSITTSSITQSNPRPKRTEPIPKSRGGSTSDSKQFSMFNLGQMHNISSEKGLVDYEVSGEGLREAIKSGDISSVKELLKKGVDANYHDKQGSSLLHIAAVFNQTDIAFALMENGADPNDRNSQGKLINRGNENLPNKVFLGDFAWETPLDCAPATLQYKMRMKMEETSNTNIG